MAKAEAQRLDRKNFIVDGSKVKRLKRVLRTSSESGAIRVAVDRTLDAAEGHSCLGAVEGTRDVGEKPCLLVLPSSSILIAFRRPRK